MPPTRREHLTDFLITLTGGPMVGTTVSHYEILNHLGGGGMGVVYKARDLKLDRLVALKFLPPDLTRDPEARQRFVHEAKAASALQHSNVCVVYDIDETHDGQMFISMEYLEGETLKKRIERGPLKIDDATDIAVQIAQGLTEAHANGIVHRDIKPANILVAKSGVTKIVDFGLAKLSGGVRMTRTGSTIGTAAYMSPEQAQGEDVDARTDIWSLGAVMYEMLTGRHPFRGEHEAALLYSIVHEDPQPISGYRPEVPRNIISAVTKALQKDRHQRYQSAAELVSDLKSPSAPAGEPAKQENSIVVLPFENLTGDPDVEYLSEGISESLMNRLARLPRLKVIARTTAFRFKGQGSDPERVGRELGVQTVVTGRVLRRGERLSISAELIDIWAKTHLWGEKYNRNFSDIFTIEDDIAGQIAERLRLQLVGDEAARMLRRVAPSTKAYDLYLQSRYHWYLFTQESLKKAVDELHQAVAEDPDYALAQAELALTYWALGNLGHMPPAEAYPRALRAAEKSLEIDGTLPEAHVALGALSWDYRWEWEDAEREFRQAIRLKPADSRAHMMYSWFLMTPGRHDESIAEMQRALELDPLSPAAAACLGEVLLYGRRYDQAIEQCRSALALDDNYWVAHHFMGMAFEQTGRLDDALAALEKAATLAERDPTIVAMLGHAYGVAGRTSEATQILHELLESRKRGYLSPFWIASVHMGLGEKERALELLKAAYEERAAYLISLGYHPHFDPLRSDPRFQELLRKMNIPGQ